MSATLHGLFIASDRPVVCLLVIGPQRQLMPQLIYDATDPALDALPANDRRKAVNFIEFHQRNPPEPTEADELRALVSRLGEIIDGALRDLGRARDLLAGQQATP